jgi:hypothetical protein
VCEHHAALPDRHLPPRAPARTARTAPAAQFADEEEKGDKAIKFAALKAPVMPTQTLGSPMLHCLLQVGFARRFQLRMLLLDSGHCELASLDRARGAAYVQGRDNVNSWSGNHHTHLVTKTWLPDALLRGRPSSRAPRAR